MNIRNTKERKSNPMNETFYTLHTFLLHAESVTYILMLASLLGIVGFWFFLTARDDDE